jgi:hypothetical protein
MRVSPIFASIITGGASALVGLLFEIGGGLIAWNIFRGVRGILFALVVGGITAWTIRRYFSLPASPIAGAIGAMVAGYMTMAFAEMVQPGSLEWAVKGGAYGAMFGVPIGAVLGALLYRPRHPGEPTKD